MGGAAAWAQGGAAHLRKLSPGIKLSVQMPSDPSDEDLQFVKQLGAEYVNIGTGGDRATYENFGRLR